MNDFDSMIEKYSRELIKAKSRSILSEIEKEDAGEEIYQDNTVDEFEENEDFVNQENNFDKVDDFDPLLITTDEPEEDLTPQNEKNEITDGLEKFQFNSIGEENQYSQNEMMQPEITENEIDVPNAPNTGFGSLKVQVSAADQVYPISSAKVSVSENKSNNVIFQGYTDSSGIIDDIALPTPSKEMSESPSVLKPYSQYDITVSHPRFMQRKYFGVPVFEGIKSIQTVQLVPSDGNANGNTQIVTESEPNDLLLERQGSENA